jgi:RNA polymerase sigma-70 factor (ECF subfamily)
MPDDYVQDTIVTALQTLHRFKNDNLFAWLVAILHGHIRNARRRAHVRTSVPLVSPGGEMDGGVATIEFRVEATQGHRLDIVDAIEALHTLSEADQEIIMLARVEGMLHEQIAEKLNVPVGTLHARLSRATVRLREAYDAEPKAGAACQPSRRRATA